MCKVNNLEEDVNVDYIYRLRFQYDDGTNLQPLVVTDTTVSCNLPQLDFDNISKEVMAKQIQELQRQLRLANFKLCKNV